MEITKLNANTPIFCIKLDRNKLKEINKNPETYAELLEKIENDIIDDAYMSEDEFMNLTVNLDFLLISALNSEDDSTIGSINDIKFTDESKGQIEINIKSGEIYIIVKYEYPVIVCVKSY